MSRARIPRWVAAAAICAAAVGCAGDPATALQQLVESRRLAADMHVQFTKAGDAANRAVMADTDDASRAFAQEAQEAIAAAQKDREALGPLLGGLGYHEESQLLEEFSRRLGEYQTLDDTILALAVENTNLKAQRLSFGQGQQSADAFRTALIALGARNAADEWHVRALVATAVGGVREIQELQAPHIAEADDAAMTKLETRMAAAESAVRRALDDLPALISLASRPKLAAAETALGEFKAVHTQLIELSRRNSNVRSLALSLGQKRQLAAACEESLAALQSALARRGFAGTR